MGTVPWRLAMGALAMVVTLSAFVVAPFVPGGSGPAPAPGRRRTSGRPRRCGHRAAADLTPGRRSRPTYGTGSLLDLPVTMSDGTILRADVYFPTKPGTTTAANGLFPVLLQQTPYGKEFIVYASAIANTNVDYLVDRGYIVVIADVRGTGDSGGTFDLFDPVQSTDGATLAQWAAHLPHSNGEVGLFGESYMGINQFQTVEAAGPNSPIKAMFPIISGNDLYADTVTQGGIPDTEFAATYIALLSGLNLTNPALQPLVAAVRSGNPHAAGQRAGQPGADDRRAQPGPRVVPAARPRRGDRAGRRRVRRRLLGGPQPGARPARGRRGRHPRLPGRRLERPLRTGRAAQLRRPAEPLRRPVAVRRHDAGPAGDAALPAADGAVAARDHGDGRQHLGPGARVVRHVAARRAHADGTTTTPLHLNIQNCRRHVGGRGAVAAAGRHADASTTSRPAGAAPTRSPTTTAT